MDRPTPKLSHDGEHVGEYVGEYSHEYLIAQSFGLSKKNVPGIFTGMFPEIFPIYFLIKKTKKNLT